ncbi:flagellar export chaperone FliS [Caldibacillus thermolactis]|jgi:flagellar secretion chaperone FliS|uniref:Flagellar secretion chaperone FliS n=1 Tax=Pallidibacillus thermolactis TaxID=251051 RepID=A0ABT2WCN8_9BACI|nr:flagellar export chaperone FliS [Pallidibacillus thermolactis]MCU9593270.1 flagellar export chaperone FliS [Pallidibacillus thermolactis]MCU9600011.1 flagellar export chaperone FliS [Pallidibacillus thermolactis subsp. kokeshiiformis]MED1673347.1 flagellar export chaperone FliS [Pallidibacillus thermolactis subsp. kokeshiiformis]
MTMSNPYQAYQQNSVNTASPGELTLMLYNGCLKFIGIAKKAIEENNIPVKNENIQKAQNIIHELMVTLNMEVEISKQMMPLYDFARTKLIEANVKNSIESLEEAETIITEFRDTWKEVLKLNRQKSFSKGGAV